MLSQYNKQRDFTKIFSSPDLLAFSRNPSDSGQFHSDSIYIDIPLFYLIHIYFASEHQNPHRSSLNPRDSNDFPHIPSYSRVSIAFHRFLSHSIDHSRIRLAALKSSAHDYASTNLSRLHRFYYYPVLRIHINYHRDADMTGDS